MEPLLFVAGVIVAVGGALAVLYRGVRWVLRGLRQLFRVADEVLGDESRPGWGKRLTAIELRLSKVEAQVTPNGGTSLHDKVDRLVEVAGAEGAVR